MNRKVNVTVTFEVDGIELSKAIENALQGYKNRLNTKETEQLITRDILELVERATHKIEVTKGEACE